MDEANRSLQQAPTKAQLHTMSAAVLALARREAVSFPASHDVDELRIPIAI
jgi:hypothetical protein